MKMARFGFSRQFLCGLCAVALAAAQGATTFNELLDEVAKAESGATVYVENDMVATGPLSVPTAITLSSPAGQTNIITRAANYGGVFINFSDAASELTLANVAVDWNKAAGSVSHFAMLSAGSLTLDAGAEVRNCDIGGNTGGIYLTGTARLVMNDGAVIRGFEGHSWAHGVQIGNNAGSPVFEMNGGLITECADHNPNAGGTSGFGGVVYVYGKDKETPSARFIMHGGTITGNTSDHNTAGVVSWFGRWYLSGAAFVTNNVGEFANDAWINSGWLCFDGDYLGRMTMRGRYEGMPDCPSQWAAYVERSNGEAFGGPIAGAGNVSSQRDPNRIINGTGTGTEFSFGDRKVSVGPGRYDEVSLHAALPHANQGDVVQIVADMVMDNYVIDGVGYNGLTNITLVGRPDNPVRVTRKDPAWRMLTVNHATVRLENLIFDGEGKTAPFEPLVQVGAEGDLTLGPGTVLCNVVTGQQHPACYVTGSGSRLTMLDGSAMHSCSTTNAESWATAIRVGENKTFEVPPRFEMKGGVISNCVSETIGSAGGGYGGAVYVQQATFVMSGGVITNNSALLGGCAGVIAYDMSEVVFTGTACVAGNPGVRPDVFRCNNGNLYMEGDFRGWVGISSGSQAYDTQLPVICREGSTGAWSFFSAGTDPIGKYRGYNWSKRHWGSGANDVAYWGNPVGWIDDAGFSTYEQYNMPNYLPTTYDLDDVDVRAGFPHTFKGTALALEGTVALTFADAEAMKSRVPLVLYTAAGDGVFTGTWNFTVPEATGGAWKVRKVTNGSGIAAYVLDWAKSGMALVIR